MLWRPFKSKSLVSRVISRDVHILLRIIESRHRCRGSPEPESKTVTCI